MTGNKAQMKHSKLPLSVTILIVLIIGILFMIVDVEEPTQIENKITDSSMITFEIEQKPSKQIPYKQETQKRYSKHLYDYFDKVRGARDKQLR